MSRRLRLLVALPFLGLVLVACGGDGTTEPAAGDRDRPCQPVGTALAERATTTVEVGLDEYAFSPSAVEVPAGIVTFAVRNHGEEEHELAFLPGGGDVPLTDGGDPDEDALGDAGAFELEAFGSGRSCAATYELEAGTYTLFCLVRAEDGSTHLSKGMQGLLTVT